MKLSRGLSRSSLVLCWKDPILLLNSEDKLELKLPQSVNVPIGSFKHCQRLLRQRHLCRLLIGRFPIFHEILLDNRLPHQENHTEGEVAL